MLFAVAAGRAWIPQRIGERSCRRESPIPTLKQGGICGSVLSGFVRLLKPVLGFAHAHGYRADGNGSTQTQRATKSGEPHSSSILTYLGFLQLPGGRVGRNLTPSWSFLRKESAFLLNQEFPPAGGFMSCPYRDLAWKFFSLLFVLLAGLSISSAAPSIQTVRMKRSRITTAPLRTS